MSNNAYLIIRIICLFRVQFFSRAVVNITFLYKFVKYLPPKLSADRLMVELVIVLELD